MIGTATPELVFTATTDAAKWMQIYGLLRPTGRPQLCFKDVCQQDLQALVINTDSWEVTTTDRDAWRHRVKLGLSQYEETQQVKAEEKRLHKKTVCLATRPTTAVTCSKCGRDCHSRIGLHSHNRRWVQIYSLLRLTDAND